MCKVYLDMDGVIANFFSEAARLGNVPNQGWAHMEYRDANKVMQKIRETPGFFANLPAFPQANTLVQSIVNIAGHCNILSSPLAGYKNCTAEKRQWLTDNIHYEFDEVHFSDKKFTFAKNNILIDDYGTNIFEWERHGGYGIKYQADEDRLIDVIIPLQTLLKTQM